jgi:hypothetical protein
MRRARAIPNGKLTLRLGRLTTLRALIRPTATGAPAFTSVALASIVVLLASPAPALATGDANNASCPNEATAGFSSALSDCRAYEQVTPVFKDGSELTLHAFAEDGSGVIARTLGGFAGTEHDSEVEGGTYELSRSPSGWTVESISPPSSSFPTQEWFAASTDLQSTLWLARTPSESISGDNFYLRAADGTMTRIGPVIPPAAAAGPPSGEFQGFLYGGRTDVRDESADLSHVFFSILDGKKEGLSWPGDTSDGESSLYEYVGTGQTRPVLVGVNNDGHLVSPCATWLGSLASQDVYNAVSRDGSTVFFTADALGEAGCVASEGPVVDELFARLDGLETVAVSEPSVHQCSACDTGAREPAEFAGASEDGSKVFFLTKQKLLPGAEGNTNLFEYDFDAPPAQHVVLASGGATPAEVQGVARVSEDGSHTYFVAQGRLSKGARGGGVVDSEEEGPCLSELGAGEKALEAVAEKKEQESEPVTTGSRCRPLLGGDNLYVFQRDAAHPAGRVSFLATLCSGEDVSGTQPAAQCPSFHSDETDWRGADQRQVQATPDGRFLVFQSFGDLKREAGDASGAAQIFEYDAETGALVRVSQGRTGYTPAKPALDSGANAAEIPAPNFHFNTRPTEANEVAVSDDGSTVVFETHAALTAEAEAPAAAGDENVYEYHDPVASGGSISSGEVYLISGETGAPEDHVKGTDASGQDIFFDTNTSLVPGDTDTQFDAYDARAHGGFLEPDPPAGCDAQACTASLYAPPAAAAPDSSSVSPAVNSPAVRAPAAMGVKRLTAAERRARSLTAALRFCHAKKNKRKRAVCAAVARRRYGPTTVHSSRRAK